MLCEPRIRETAHVFFRRRRPKRHTQRRPGRAFVEAHRLQNAAGFLKLLDEELKKINIEYKAKRDSMRLGAPVLHIMKEGWYERGRRQLAAEGKRMFQAKTEKLSPIKLATMEPWPVWSEAASSKSAKSY